MKEELNIAEILKDKPKGTKLYSPIFGEVKYDSVLLGDIKILYSCIDRHSYIDGKFCMNRECLLFPSREMRDWDKFAWEKGDVLINNKGAFCIFKEFSGYPYTNFVAIFVYIAGVSTSDSTVEVTQEWHKASGENAGKYIKLININLEKENKRLNLKTLEVEKLQPKFKDGDILTCPSASIYNSSTFILKECNMCGYLYYAAIEESKLYISTGNVWCGKNTAIRYATEEEKTKLFDALTKEGKRWNAENKIFEDIKPVPKKENATYKKKSDMPEHKFEPFEKVLVRDKCNEPWRAAFFSYINEYKRYVTTSMAWKYCVPYKGNESLLGTTKDVEE